MIANLDWTGKTVLIVDDMEKVRQRVKELYESVGLIVAGYAGDGLEALEAIKNLKPDLVSLDIVMPVMDGIECYRKIQKLNDERLAGKIGADEWPGFVKVMILSCLASEIRVVAKFSDEINEQIFVPKYPNAETLIKHLNHAFRQTPESRPKKTQIKESA